jgi:hypothetical protein
MVCLEYPIHRFTMSGRSGEPTFARCYHLLLVLDFKTTVNSRGAGRLPSFWHPLRRLSGNI